MSSRKKEKPCKTSQKKPEFCALSIGENSNTQSYLRQEDGTAVLPFLNSEGGIAPIETADFKKINPVVEIYQLRNSNAEEQKKSRPFGRAGRQSIFGSTPRRDAWNYLWAHYAIIYYWSLPQCVHYWCLGGPRLVLPTFCIFKRPRREEVHFTAEELMKWFLWIFFKN